MSKQRTDHIALCLIPSLSPTLMKDKRSLRWISEQYFGVVIIQPLLWLMVAIQRGTRRSKRNPLPNVTDTSNPFGVLKVGAYIAPCFDKR